MPATSTKFAVGNSPRLAEHGPQPLSRNTSRRLLAKILDQAEAGDVAAAEALVRLSWQRATLTAPTRPALDEPITGTGDAGVP